MPIWSIKAFYLSFLIVFGCFVAIVEYLLIKAYSISSYPANSFYIYFFNFSTSNRCLAFFFKFFSASLSYIICCLNAIVSYYCSYSCYSNSSRVTDLTGLITWFLLRNSPWPNVTLLPLERSNLLFSSLAIVY